MNKLSKEMLDVCTAANCCINELVVLPTAGDVGFEEYFEHKAGLVIDAKNIFSPPERNKLILAYPKPDSKEPYIFDKFFASSSMVARNQEFEGCFAIDISAYIGRTDDEYFSKLISYMQSNESAVYVLFMYSDNKNEIQNMFDALLDFDEFRLVNLSLPSAKTLTEYTVSKIRDFCLHVTNPVSDFLEKYFSQKKCGFDFADNLVRRLKNAGFAGELSVVEETVKEVNSAWGSNGRNTDFGY